jgi:hypothetical protein
VQVFARNKEISSWFCAWLARALVASLGQMRKLAERNGILFLEVAEIQGARLSKTCSFSAVNLFIYCAISGLYNGAKQCRR